MSSSRCQLPLNTPMKLFAALVSLICSTIVFGGVEGVYEVDADALRESIKKTPDYVASPASQQEMMVGVAEEMKLQLTLRADKTFEAVADMMGQHNVAEGTYVLEETELVLTTTKDNGAEKAEPEIARFKVDGENFRIEEPEMPFSFLLRKTDG